MLQKIFAASALLTIAILVLFIFCAIAGFNTAAGFLIIVLGLCLCASFIATLIYILTGGE